MPVMWPPHACLSKVGKSDWGASLVSGICHLFRFCRLFVLWVNMVNASLWSDRQLGVAKSH